MTSGLWPHHIGAHIAERVRGQARGKRFGAERVAVVTIIIRRKIMHVVRSIRRLLSKGRDRCLPLAIGELDS